MTDADRIAQLERRLARERRIREEAELISERATRALYDQQQGLLLLHAVTNAINDASSLDAAVASALDMVRAHNEWTLGHAWLLDEADQLVPTGLWCGATERFEAFCRQTSETQDAGLPARVLAERGPVWLSDVTRVPWFTRATVAADAGLHAALAFPVVAGPRIVGVLEFFDERVLEPAPAQQELMSQIGTHLGRASERHAADALLHLATHDMLTGLPNRALLLDHLRRALSRSSRRPGEHVAVFFIDLDGFKAVNDAVGHGVGDDVLRRAALRLQSVVRPHDTFGRLGGDEFVLVCEAVRPDEAVGPIAERLLDALARPLLADGKRFVLHGSIGVALAAEDVTAEALLERADAAMYQAKEAGRGRYSVYSADLRERISRRLDLLEGLRNAVAREELHLVYQPEIDLADGRVVGVEALLRWTRPTGLVMPGDFIPLAEETGLIVPIGAWVLEEAVRESAGWERDPAIATAPWIAVNLSVRQLADPYLVKRVAAAVRFPGAAARLVLEVTESGILKDADAGIQLLNHLRALGPKIAIDDFGTGYASLAYLRRFPASILKVDRSFVAAVEEEGTRAIVGAVIEMAHALGLKVVAEGIETREQLAILRALGCDIGQGYLFARPMPPDEVAAILRDRPGAKLDDLLEGVSERPSPG